MRIERITPDLRDEIQQMITREPPLKAYRIARRTFYFGEEVKYGGFGNDWVVRFFHRDAGTIQEWGFHGDFQLDFKPGKLQGKLLHYTCNTMDEYFRRFQTYTDGGAKFLKSKNKNVNFTPHSITAPLAVYSPVFSSLRFYGRAFGPESMFAFRVLCVYQISQIVVLIP